MPTQKELAGKVLFLAGVGPQMGSATALIAAREGAKVVLAARSTEQSSLVAAQIREAGAQAQIGATHMAHYTASKGGVAALTRSLAVELAPKGITVTAVSPGFILTPMAQRAIDADLFPVPYEEIVATYPIPRVGRPDEAAAAIAFFASEDAAYITGQTLGVNGGCCP